MVGVLLSSAHSVGESNLHMVFTPAYRRDVTLSMFFEQARQLGIVLAALDFGPDHLHLFITQYKRWSIVELAQRLKGATSRALRRNYRYLFDDKLWEGKFWTGGYFYRTVGIVTAETVKRYVEESQQKHWEQQPTTQQRTLVAYA